MPDDADWLRRIRALPDLLAIARERSSDPYDLMPSLRDERVRRGEPYVWTTIGPHSATCSAGEHQIPAMTREIVRPGGGPLARLVISEVHLHDIEHHGRKLTPDQLRKLAVIFSGGGPPNPPQDEP